MSKYFVYQPSSLGPSAQIWHEMQVDGNGKPQLTLSKPVLLADEDKRSIEELKRVYPLCKVVDSQ